MRTPGARAQRCAFGGYALTAYMQLTHTPLNALSGVQGAPLGAPGRTGRTLARTGAPKGAPWRAKGAPWRAKGAPWRAKGAPWRTLGRARAHLSAP